MAQLKMLRYPAELVKHPLKPGVRVETHCDAYTQRWCDMIKKLTHNDAWRPYTFKCSMLDKPDIKPDQIFYAIAPDGMPVATSTARIDPATKHGTVHMVYADESYRGLGLGRAVCEAVVECFEKNGVLEADLCTDDDRLAAISLYLSLGFLPYLYDETMPERWSEIKKKLNLETLAAFDADKKKTSIA